MAQIGRMSIGRSQLLLASIHDVSPRFEGEVDRLLDLLCPYVGQRLAMLVVPNHWGDAPIVPGSPFAARLRGWSDAGVEMFLHGFTHRDDIAAVVESALKSSGLTGDRLTLELTESSIVQDPARATRVFDALKALDATVAMDDFGTGYSSLAYLQRLPIDVLKIDKSFVSGMMVDPDAVAIVRAVLSLAEALGMSTTAEGIETVELATTLATLGCASGQGFYFAKPLQADQALEYWKARRR